MSDWKPGDYDPRDAPGIKAAIKGLKKGRRGRPTEADAPPPSLFPMTPAARAALDLRKDK